MSKTFLQLGRTPALRMNNWKSHVSKNKTSNKRNYTCFQGNFSGMFWEQALNFLGCKGNICAHALRPHRTYLTCFRLKAFLAFLCGPVRAPDLLTCCWDPLAALKASFSLSCIFSLSFRGHQGGCLLKIDRLGWYRFVLSLGFFWYRLFLVLLSVCFLFSS